MINVGILSISYLVGDAAARQWMGMLIEHGFGWRALFYFAAAVVGLLLVVNFLFLRESRLDAGFTEAKPNPLNLFAGSESRPKSVAQLPRLPLCSVRRVITVYRPGLHDNLVNPSISTLYIRVTILPQREQRGPVFEFDFPGVGAFCQFTWLAERSTGGTGAP